MIGGIVLIVGLFLSVASTVLGKLLLGVVVAWVCEQHERHIEQAGGWRAPRSQLPVARRVTR